MTNGRIIGRCSRISSTSRRTVSRSGCWCNSRNGHARVVLRQSTGTRNSATVGNSLTHGSCQHDIPLGGAGNLFLEERRSHDRAHRFLRLGLPHVPDLSGNQAGEQKKQVRMRIEISQLLNGQYGMNYELEEITDCDGCRTEGGRLFSGCKNCLIRKCAREKGLENCAYCAEYACERLEAFFSSDQNAKIRLDEIRAAFGSQVHH